ncbi:MAG: LCP family protein, partial [Clostridium celatum]|nr:LCP family protein [Clostridium celatum]
INIALFGVDAVDGGVGRSDSIMIATLDTVNKKLKLTSIMRDSYVAIDGHGNDKINHAYAFGGPQLAIKTLNENFDLNIEDFASVNFETLPKIIDKIGGIELDIDADELKYINGYISNLNNINGTSEPEIESTGLQHVSGTQALAFCRIRYTSGGDYKRTERHREVLTKILEKIETLPATSYPSLLSDILPMVNTSLDYSKILELGTEVLKLGDSSMELERFPRDEYCEGKLINEIYYLTFDKETTVNQLHNYIFEDKITW